LTNETDDLPDSWALEPIGNLCDINPKHSKELPDELEISFVPMASVDEITGTIQKHQAKEVQKVRRGYTHFAEGDVIFAKITPCMENGKSAIARDLKNNLACGSTEFHVLRSRGGVLSEYLHPFLRQVKYRNNAAQEMTGAVGHKRVPKQYLLDSKLPLPPLKEQHRIVTKIETLTTHSRKAREALDAINQHEKDLVLYYTNEWKESELGEHIEEYKKLVGNDWETYHSVGVSNSGFITKRKEPIAPKSAPRCKVVQPGDIVFNPIRFSIGSVARHYGREAVIVSPEYQVFRTKDTISSELVLRYLKSAQGRSRLEIATQGSVRYRVYLKNLKSMKMPIAPPIQQQKAEEFFSAINRIKEISITVTSELDRLDQSILAKAFRGELVPQDPTDEPATLLLQRIQTERENLKAKGKRKTRKKK